MSHRFRIDIQVTAEDQYVVNSASCQSVSLNRLTNIPSVQVATCVGDEGIPVLPHTTPIGIRVLSLLRDR
jgi:hypothetical protein